MKGGYHLVLDPERTKLKYLLTFHLQVVEWLLNVVNHLPSEDQCQKCLVAPVDDKEKHDDMMLGRTKCYDLVTKVSCKESAVTPLEFTLIKCQKLSWITVVFPSSLLDRAGRLAPTSQQIRFEIATNRDFSLILGALVH